MFSQKKKKKKKKLIKFDKLNEVRSVNCKRGIILHVHQLL